MLLFETFYQTTWIIVDIFGLGFIISASNTALDHLFFISSRKYTHAIIFQLKLNVWSPIKYCNLKSGFWY